MFAARKENVPLVFRFSLSPVVENCLGGRHGSIGLWQKCSGGNGHGLPSAWVDRLESTFCKAVATSQAQGNLGHHPVLLIVELNVGHD
jgi:hypothetical protein